MGPANQVKKKGEIPLRAGRTMVIMGALLGVSHYVIPAETFSGALPLVALMQPVLIVGGAFLYWRGRQYVSRASAAAILCAGHPTVLYLRAFAADSSGIGNVLSSIVPLRLLEGLSTEEELLRDVLQPFGDMVAVGKPNESLPTPGAARLYTSDAEWKDVVSGQMRAARLVVIRAGKGAGLQWELEQATRLLEPRRLLILITMAKRHYEVFKEQAASRFNLELPAFTAIKHMGIVSGFLRFGPDWQSSFLPLRLPPFFRRSLYKPQQRQFQFALKAVFEEFGLPWKPPPLSIMMVTSCVLLVLCVGFLVFLFAMYG